MTRALRAAAWIVLFSAIASTAVQAKPYDGMKLVFADEFDGDSLDSSRWFAGPKPEGDGAQWGGAYFVKKTDREYTDVYKVSDGLLRIRAFHDEKYKDPNGWNRKWFSGEISSAFPNGSVPGGARKGYFVARMKMPATPGAWPAFWLLSTDSVLKTGRASVEIDIVEFYGHYKFAYMANIHHWLSPNPEGTGRNMGGVPELQGADLTAEFHDYGLLLTENEAVWYFDDKEVFRTKLYRADDPKLDQFYVLLDLAISTDWPVKIPESGYIDLLVDSVRIYRPD